MKNSFKLLLVLFFSLGMMSFQQTKISFIETEAFLTAHNWELLGKRIVNVKADHDEIMVTAHEGTFTKLKFRILKAPIIIRNVKIVFGNGENKNIILKRKFAAGGESKIIDLPGNKRIIKKIVLNYKAIPGKGKAVVAVWGKH